MVIKNPFNEKLLRYDPETQDFRDSCGVIWRPCTQQLVSSSVVFNKAAILENGRDISLDQNHKLNQQPVRETRIRVERRKLELPIELFNEAAKPPYQHLFKSSSFDKILFAALEKVGLAPKSPVTYESPNRFDSVIVNVPIEEEYEEAPKRELVALTRILQAVRELPAGEIYKPKLVERKAVCEVISNEIEGGKP